MTTIRLASVMPKDLAEKLRAAIRKSKLSCSQLSMETKVPQTTISRFLRGKDMGIARASKIATYLGLELKRKS